MAGCSSLGGRQRLIAAYGNGLDTQLVIAKSHKSPGAERSKHPRGVLRRRPGHGRFVDRSLRGRRRSPCRCRRFATRPEEVSTTPSVIRLLLPALPLLAPALQPSLDLRLIATLLRLVVDAPCKLFWQIRVVHPLGLVVVCVAVTRAEALLFHEPRHGIAEVHGNLWRVVLAHVCQGRVYAGVGCVGFRRRSQIGRSLGERYTSLRHPNEPDGLGGRDGERETVSVCVADVF